MASAQSFGICALLLKIPELVGVGAIGELRVDPENASRWNGEANGMRCDGVSVIVGTGIAGRGSQARPL
jgi:hypothetical protein